MSEHDHLNALAGETSPYLLQHAGNPVQWYPWGPEALALAREQNRPILLSIGYSACHWCHVMAHESFEDQATAALMNRLFVNVKVDREERPDLDRLYQLAHQLLARRPGGWPLTVFLSPLDQAPFFAGTYFPSEPRHGMPSFRQLLEHIARAWEEQPDELAAQNEALLRALTSLEPVADPDAELGGEPLARARTLLAQSYDRQHGGFGTAPKFPHPTNLERLLRDHADAVLAGRDDENALAMVSHTLRRMAEGGIHDHLGGGFCRYATDEQWMIPHFEKMLYDNGPLLALLACGWQVTGEELFRERALQIAGWVLREMRSPEGGFYSALDADSEGEEGRFYVWQRDEARALLSDDEYTVTARRFGLDRPPNFEGSAWHLHAYEDVESVADALQRAAHETAGLLDSARAKLFAAREQRVHPGLDDKILTAWNALMVKGLAVAGRALGEPEMLIAAERALDFVQAHLWRDGRLLAVTRDGRSHLPAYLDDHAFLIDAVLSLLEARWRDGDLEFAIELAELLLQRFEADDGGFYFTADDHETLLARQKPAMDDALPCGNGIAAFALARLGHVLGEMRYLDAAARTLRALWRGMREHPHAHAALLLALEEAITPPQLVILRGEGEALARWSERATARYAPRRLSLAIPDTATRLPGLLAERDNRCGEVTAWICEGHTCRAPVGDFEAYSAALAAAEVTPPL